MKTLSLVIGLLSLLSSAHTFADEAPSWWGLPNKGENCVLKSTFTDGQVTCGTSKYEVWSCVTPSTNAYSAASSTDYLLVGEYGSDTVGGCSPTYVVKKVVQQN